MIPFALTDIWPPLSPLPRQPPLYPFYVEALDKLHHLVHLKTLTLRAFADPDIRRPLNTLTSALHHFIGLIPYISLNTLNQYTVYIVIFWALSNMQPT